MENNPQSGQRRFGVRVFNKAAPPNLLHLVPILPPFSSGWVGQTYLASSLEKERLKHHGQVSILVILKIQLLPFGACSVGGNVLFLGAERSVSSTSSAALSGGAAKVCFSKALLVPSLKGHQHSFPSAGPERALQPEPLSKVSAAQQPATATRQGAYKPLVLA